MESAASWACESNLGLYVLGLYSAIICLHSLTGDLAALILCEKTSLLNDEATDHSNRLKLRLRSVLQCGPDDDALQTSLTEAV